MIFLWGLLEDATTRSVYECLDEIGAPVAFVNHADIARTIVRLAGDGAEFCHLTCGAASHELDEMSAAYLRPYDHRDYAGYVKPAGDAPAIGSSALVHHLLGAWADGTPALVINRPTAEASNHSKLFQATHIRAGGFSVPASLVTNEPDRAREFQRRHGRVIYKSMSSVRSVVQELDASALDAIGPMGPVLFQERVIGTNVRAHVVGEAVFAAAIESDGVDYRYADATRMSRAELPPEIAERCVTLAKRLGLVVAGLDLIVTASGEWYCLEANPSPAFAVFEAGGSREIARQVAELLAAG
ncbi:MAG: RimK domain-containing protein ATP-grasp [Gemmatimonadaceae bacterium]